ncbi:hypothetical protein V1477_000126 [Vespula maculifrons]|uniref:Uncharacterized protein n=1 Tax=Vespula maculifrons TaxID=7453 RepID=A0ABD2D2N4_VESMC
MTLKNISLIKIANTGDNFIICKTENIKTNQPIYYSRILITYSSIQQSHKLLKTKSRVKVQTNSSETFRKITDALKIRNTG